jgi:hypothetical protein
MLALTISRFPSRSFFHVHVPLWPLHERASRTRAAPWNRGRRVWHVTTLTFKQQVGFIWDLHVIIVFSAWSMH